MKKLGLLIINLSFVISVAGQSKPEIDFFYPDEWFAPIEKPDAKKNDSYFGIYDVEEHYRFKQMCNVKRINLKDTLIEEAAYGLVRVLSIDSIKPVFIISGINLKNKKEVSGINLAYSVMIPGTTVSYSIGQKHYSIYSKGNYETNNNEQNPYSSINSYQVILRLFDSNRITEQVLYKAASLDAWPAGGFEGGVVVRWMGDLDSDNEIDIILTTSTDYRSWDVILLMTASAKDKIVQEVKRYSGSAP